MARILVVDDERMVRQNLCDTLESAGHTVVEAEDGDQALARFSSDEPDLVLTDIIMPKREGIETIGEMRRIDARVPIIAISGGGSVGGDLFLTLARALGATRTLSKPFARAALLEAVEDCLSQRGPAVICC